MVRVWVHTPRECPGCSNTKIFSQWGIPLLSGSCCSDLTCNNTQTHFLFGPEPDLNMPNPQFDLYSNHTLPLMLSLKLKDKVVRARQNVITSRKMSSLTTNTHTHKHTQTYTQIHNLTHRISSIYLKGRLNISMYSRNRVQCWTFGEKNVSDVFDTGIF